MSLRTTETTAALQYATRRIELDNSLILVAYENDEGVILVTPLDSDVPVGYTVLGTFYWNNAVEFRGNSTLT